MIDIITYLFNVLSKKEWGSTVLLLNRLSLIIIIIFITKTNLKLLRLSSEIRGDTMFPTNRATTRATTSPNIKT